MPRRAHCELPYERGGEMISGWMLRQDTRHGDRGPGDWHNYVSASLTTSPLDDINN